MKALAPTIRCGLIVPSSNVTMEIEIPEMVRAAMPDAVSFHASRMRMRRVTEDELRAMDEQSIRCAEELADVPCEVIAYACLVAVMVQGPGAHRKVEERLRDTLRARQCDAPVVSSAGALVDTLHRLGASRIGVLAPYLRPLTDTVVAYLEAESFVVPSSHSLEVADNFDVGCIPPDELLRAVDLMDLDDVDALVLSACVQMPSLGIVEKVQAHIGVPVVTAATATAASVVAALGGETGSIPGAAGAAWSKTVGYESGIGGALSSDNPSGETPGAR
jgi:maleate isomerase